MDVHGKPPTASTVDVNLSEKTIQVDGEPFPWLITGFKIATRTDHIATLTVEIPVQEITVELRE